MATDPKQALTNAERWFRNRLPGQMVDPHARMPSGMSIRQDRDTQVEAEGRFLERDANIRDLNQHLSPSILFSNLLAIVYPSVPGYGPEHGKHTSQLSVYCAATEGLTNVTEVETLKAAGLLHDLGRATPAGTPDRDHALRSAERADRAIRSDPSGSGQGALREAVCRLIAQHSLDKKDPPQDPLARALWDADSLEAARHAPNTARGRAFVVERYARLLSPWARKKSVQVKWLKKYGWDVKEWSLD
jgi:HD superfamily phosphodiesterase